MSLNGLIGSNLTVDVVVTAGNLVGMGPPNNKQFQFMTSWPTSSCTSKKTKFKMIVKFVFFFAGLSTTANLIFTFFISCIYFLFLF